LIEQGLTSPPTQYRLYGRRFFYRCRDLGVTVTLILSMSSSEHCQELSTKPIREQTTLSAVLFQATSVYWSEHILYIGYASNFGVQFCHMVTKFKEGYWRGLATGKARLPKAIKRLSGLDDL